MRPTLLRRATWVKDARHGWRSRVTLPATGHDIRCTLMPPSARALRSSPPSTPRRRSTESWASGSWTGTFGGNARATSGTADGGRPGELDGLLPVRALTDHEPQAQDGSALVDAQGAGHPVTGAVEG